MPPPSDQCNGLRIVHTIGSLSDHAAGPSYTVPRLAEALSDLGHRITLMSLGAPVNTAGKYMDRRFKQDWPRAPVLQKLAISSNLRSALNDVQDRVDVLHTHGFWLMPNIYPANASRSSGKPLLISPRGMLAPAALQFSRNAKRALWVTLQHRAASAATCFHATSAQEYSEIRAAGLRAPIAIVPNGVDVPPADTTADREISRSRTLLYLGRVHPKKGIDRLLRAWAALQERHQGWSLRIVGPSECGYGRELRALAGSLGLKRASFEDGAYGVAKEKAYRDASLVVLPTQNENFGMVVAEALACGTPVICTRCAPWRGLEEHACGWWIDEGARPLIETLDRAMKLPEPELNTMGARGRDWMLRSFSWGALAGQLSDVYLWLKYGGRKPDCVTID